MAGWIGLQLIPKNTGRRPRVPRALPEDAGNRARTRPAGLSVRGGQPDRLRWVRPDPREKKKKGAQPKRAKPFYLSISIF